MAKPTIIFLIARLVIQSPSDLASLTIISSLSVDGEIWTTRLFGSSLEHIFQEVSSQAELEAIIVDKDNHCFQTGGIYKMRIS